MRGLGVRIQDLPVARHQSKKFGELVIGQSMNLDPILSSDS